MNRHNAEAIEHLDRCINSMARVLQHISKMDRSKISPDLVMHIQTLIRYVIRDNVSRSSTDCIPSELSSVATKWNKGKARGPREPGDEVRALAEDINRALSDFQVRVQ